MKDDYLKRMSKTHLIIILLLGALLAVFLVTAGCLSGNDPKNMQDNKPDGLEFTDYVGINDLKDTFLILGTARNNADLPIRQVRLQIDYQDSNHTLLASQIYEEDVLILPNESWKFEIPYTDPVVPQINYYYITPLQIEFVR
ncbi:MAG: hypothetical protein HGA55_07360 [Methanoregulaceae archaeon]|nr:hypothetical protein [Methanoregulaceae archaeon]